MARPKRTDIRQFILWNVEEHPRDIVAQVMNKFGVARQTANNHLRALTEEGLLSAAGQTKARRYFLRNFLSEKYSFDLRTTKEEHIVWREHVSPLLSDLPKNILDICQYGFNEIFNNVIDHSNGERSLVWILRNATTIEIRVLDNGVGIFQKLQDYFGLDDPRHALLELSKGKVTSDPDNHTGEGIFFTSRMFDKFCIWSDNLFYSKQEDDEDDGWIIEIEDRKRLFKGTGVSMLIAINAKQTSKEVIKKFENDDHGFAKTHIPLSLARYEGERLVSRSQARRLLSRVDRFEEVLLDFTGVESIGRAFADEIFRVYQAENPRTRIIALRTNDEVRKTIEAAERSRVEEKGA